MRHKRDLTPFYLWAITAASIVAVIVTAVGWIQFRQQVQIVAAKKGLEDHLRAMQVSVDGILQDYDSELQSLISESELNGNAIRPDYFKLVNSPLIDFLVTYDRSTKRRLFPLQLEQYDQPRRAAIEQAYRILTEEVSSTSREPATQSANPSDSTATKNRDRKYWISWHLDRHTAIGLVLRNDVDSRWSMVVFPFSRWMTAVMERLAAFEHALDAGYQVEVIESNRRVMHRMWTGKSFNPNVASELQAAIPLSAPLENWEMTIVPDKPTADALIKNRDRWPIVWLAAVASGLIFMTALSLHRRLRSKMRDAEQKLTFVNQVSHELRTPLTNICMYAELLRSELSETYGLTEQEIESNESPPAIALGGSIEHKIDVICNESQRLNRLINNVLEFGRKNSDALRYCPAIFDDIVEHAIDAFLPSFAEHSFAIVRQYNAGDLRMIDVDAVEQILVNLISNVQKYGVHGKYLRLQTCAMGSKITLEIANRGEAIPKSLQEKIFQPFYRMNNSISSAAGSGLGLSVARELARRHGGDCILKTASGSDDQEHEIDQTIFVVEIAAVPCGDIVDKQRTN